MKQDPLQSSGISLQKKLQSLWNDVRWPVLLGAGFISLVTGMAGFMKLHHWDGTLYNWIDAFYQSIQLFSMNAGEASALGANAPWQLQVARLFSPVLAAFAVLQALAIIFRDQMQLISLGFLRNHIIICGLGRRGLLLTKEFRQQGLTVVVIEADTDNDLIDTCREYGALILNGDARDPLTLTKAGVLRARYIVAASGEDGTNAEVALQVRQMAERPASFWTPPRSHPLVCLVHIYDRQLWTFLREQEFEIHNNCRFYIEYFNIFDIGARLMLQEHPAFPPAPDPSLQPAVLLVGIGHFGESLAVHLAQEWYPHFLQTGRPLHISVVDPQCVEHIAYLTMRFPFMNQLCEFSLHAVDTFSPKFQDGSLVLDEQQRCQVQNVYICLDDDPLALSTGLALLQQLRAFPVTITVRMSEDHGLADLLHGVHNVGGGKASLYAFGLLDRTCKPGILEDGTHEILARVIHAGYIQHEAGAAVDGSGIGLEPRPELRSWNALPEVVRQSNLQQAELIPIKLHAIGCGIAPWTDFGAEQFHFSDEEIDCMAALEQDRYINERAAWGWRYGPMRDPLLKTHPALLSWTDSRLREEDRERTRNSVRKIPLFLARAGFQVYRIRR
jgi:hypothetical protein